MAVVSPKFRHPRGWCQRSGQPFRVVSTDQSDLLECFIRLAFRGGLAREVVY